MTEEEYIGSIYSSPRIAIVIGEFLRAPREIGHSGNFTDLFSSVREEQRDYIDGLLVVSVIFSVLFFIWAFILTVLKCKGKEVGCASGRAFVNSRPKNERNETDVTKIQDDVVSTSVSSNESSSVSSSRPLFSEHGNIVIEKSSSDFIDANNHHSRREKWSSIRRQSKKTTKRNIDSPDVTKTNRRERRTRLVFIFFASMVLICAPFTLSLSFGPIKEVTTQSSENLILMIRTTINEVETSLSTIDSASSSAIELVSSVPTDLNIICPLVNETAFESLLGVDIRDIIGTIVEQQDRLREEVESRLSVGQSFVNGLEEGLSSLEISIDKSGEFVWIVPGLLFGICVLAIASILGVVLAWKEKSGVGLQRVMSYVVLPLLILTAVVFWLIVVLSSLSTMIGTDVCLSSSSNGSPDQTIQEILSVVGHGMDDTIFQLVSTNTNQCKGPDPTEDIQNLKIEIQDYIDNIWRQISRIDSIGRAEVMEKCGGVEAFTDMLAGARDIAKLLTTIRRSLSSTVESIGCHSINAIYTQAAHDIICTETLSASVYGFITFLIMLISVMMMISLRASWLRNIEEEKVYHDETEIAENMVLDEHEEYLAYISRYKHEWQEYEGFEEEGAVKEATANSSNNELKDEISGYTDSHHGWDSGYYYESEDFSCDAYESDLSSIGNVRNNQEPYQHNHDIDEGTLHSSGGISFTTFSGEHNERIHHDVGKSGERVSQQRQQPPLLPHPSRQKRLSSPPPPPINPEFCDNLSKVNIKHRRRVSVPSTSRKSKQSHIGINSQSNFESDYNHNFSHNLQSTGEVEVELYDV